jgi:hypothetical protein
MMPLLLHHLIVILPCLLIGLAASAETDRFGGTLAIQREATGHFRVEQVKGRWMFITPEGHGYLALGANHTGKYMSGQHAELLKRFSGNETKAAAALAQTIRGLGLNAGEAYAPFWPPLQSQMPWIANISYPPGAQNHRFDVFDPAWQAKLQKHIEREAAAFASEHVLLRLELIRLPTRWLRSHLRRLCLDASEAHAMTAAGGRVSWGQSPG